MSVPDPSNSSPVFVPRTRRQSRGWWIAALILVLLPPIVGLLLLASRQMTFTEIFPFWSDETYYWHQAATFARVGFNGGYYTAAEVPAPAAFSHFYAWGLFLPVFYGGIGALVGWPWWAIPVINVLMVSLALLLWVVLVRPRPAQMMAAGVLLFTFAPFLTYLPTSMAELLHMAFAIALAAGFYTLWQRRHRSDSLGWMMFVMALVLVASGFRITWAMLLPVVGLIGLWPRGKGWALVGVLIGLVLGAGMYKFFSWTSAPYPGNLEALTVMGQDVGRGLSMLLTQISENAQGLLRGSDLEMALRLQIVSVWAVIMLAAFGPRLMRKNPSSSYDGWDILLYTAIFMGIFALLMLFYLVGNAHDYRFFAPLVLMGGFLLIARQHWLPLVVLIGLSLVVLFPAVTTFGQRATDYHAQQAEIVPIMRDWEQAIKDEVAYDPAAPSPWCNTLTYTSEFLNPPYLPVLMDPGIGFTLIFDLPDDPLKARYLLLDAAFLARHEAKLSMDLIMPVPNGGLYRNRNAVC